MNRVSTVTTVVVIVAAMSLGALNLDAEETEKEREELSSLNAAINTLESTLRQQQEEIARLSQHLAELRARLGDQNATPADISSSAPMNPSLAAERTETPAPGFSAVTLPRQSVDGPGATGQQQYATRLDNLTKKVDTTAANLGGFRFSGDFRLRLDAQLRSGNTIASPLQNIRSRYRLRLNIDKELDSMFRFHLQLSTGPFNNGLTNDQDMAGTVAKHPFSVAEVYIDFRPTTSFSMRGGRMEEVHADNLRFLWDDDVRFNGFQQVFTISFNPGGTGLKSIEFNAGEYFLTNPNVQIVPAGSPFLTAGYALGTNVRDSNLFDPGFLIKHQISENWSQHVSGNFQIYRNPNEIQLASTAAGFPALVSNVLGLTLSGPMTGTGNTTTTPGGAMYTARNFQIAHATYRLTHKGIAVGAREMPFFFDFQVARNTGTTYQRDAIIGSVNFGAVKTKGDIRVLYQFGLKQANSMISQFTDDDFGTGSGVNIRAHAIRVDAGLTRFLQVQNLLFLQREISASDAGRLFFVPLQAGAERTYRYQGQLAFTY
ncbi:MAG TPA: putative porin [Terriglobia bacterium]|nr:putative porin [Terriglobia bacterium]